MSIVGAGLTMQDIIDEVKARGVDVQGGDARLLTLLNLRAREMVTRARWLQGIVQVATTVADQADYDIPQSVHEIVDVKVGATPYEVRSVRTWWELRDGQRRRVGRGGFCVETFDPAGTRKLTLWPVPASSGDVIEALCVLRPGDVAATDPPPVPDEFHRKGLVEGLLAWCLDETDEDPQVAQVHEDRFQQAIEELRRLGNTRVGSSVQRAQIQGVHFG